MPNPVIEPFGDQSVLLMYRYMRSEQMTELLDGVVPQAKARGK